MISTRKSKSSLPMPSQPQITSPELGTTSGLLSSSSRNSRLGNRASKCRIHPTRTPLLLQEEIETIMREDSSSEAATRMTGKMGSYPLVHPPSSLASEGRSETQATPLRNRETTITTTPPLENPKKRKNGQREFPRSPTSTAGPLLPSPLTSTPWAP